MNISGKTLTADTVARYLQQHPEFFQDHAEIIAHIAIPHPDHGERTISLTTQQLLTLREQNRKLEHELRKLIQLGKENDTLGEKMHALTLTLCASRSLEAALHALGKHLHSHFSIHQVSIRLWSPAQLTADMPQESSHPVFTTNTTELQALTEKLPTPYCGPLTAPYASLWIGPEKNGLQSQALIPIRMPSSEGLATPSLGIIALGASESERFTTDLSTHYLSHFSEIVATTITRLSPSA